MKRHLDKWMIFLGIVALSWGVQTIAQIGGGSNKFPTVSATDRVLGRQSAGAGAIEEIVCTSFARSILDDTTAAAVRTTIGAGTGSGTVTDVTGTSPIASTGGATPAISLDDTAVAPGSYTYSALTVDAKGRLTSASSGTAPYVPGGTDVAVADGGTGASTHTDNAVLFGAGAGVIEAVGPGTNGQVLAGVTGANAAWVTVSGGGELSAAGILTAYDREVQEVAAARGENVVGFTWSRMHTQLPSAVGVAAAGQLHLFPVWLPTCTVASIRFVTVAAANGPTNGWVALYDSSKSLLSQSADNGAGAIAATTVYTWALGTPQAITAGVFWVGFCFTATVSTPGILRLNTEATLETGCIFGLHDAGLTTTAPATATFSVVTTSLPWLEVVGS